MVIFHGYVTNDQIQMVTDLPPGAGDLQQRQAGPTLGGLRRPHVARKAGAGRTRPLNSGDMWLCIHPNGHLNRANDDKPSFVGDLGIP